MMATPEQVKELKETYKSNKEGLKFLEQYIKKNGVTDDGLTDVTESFEQGWNNAMEYVFDLLDIKYTLTVDELMLDDEYEFECNLTEEYRDIETDEWGCAFIWLDDIGVEYNFCIDGGTNSCAIYKTVINSKGYMATDYDEYIHYEIDFDDKDWVEKLEVAMCEALIKFHDL